VLQEEKQMSYLNLLDADAAWELVREFEQPAAACIKHCSPSGVAIHADIAEAFQRSYDADRLSAFGVIIALNRSCPKVVAQKIVDQKIFAEIIIAPDYEPEALEVLKQKPKIRIIRFRNGTVAKQPLYRSALGGVLIQNRDDRPLTKKDLQCVTKAQPSTAQIADLLFAWQVVKHAKSNAIVLASDSVTLGIGAGQTSRVEAVIIAARHAGERASGSVMASDAFFPFPDSIDEAASHGVAAIIQPGGSIRDAEVIAKADELKIPMLFTGVRGFRH
jgi:phosphoribosylaminoimidazolecarboxamide formyltransferase/IMP cyclohydrolase